MNYLAIALSAVLGMMIGFVWYGPIFGKVWLKLSGCTPEDMEKAQKEGMGKTYALAFISLLVTAWIMSLMIYQFELGMGSSLRLAFLVWLGFIVPTMLNSVLWERKPVKLYFIGIAERLVTFLSMSGLLSLWR